MYLVEASYVFGGRQVRLPYSTGLLWSHCQTNDTIKTNYELTDIFFIRDEVETFIDSLKIRRWLVSLVSYGIGN